MSMLLLHTLLALLLLKAGPSIRYCIEMISGSNRSGWGSKREDGRKRWWQRRRRLLVLFLSPQVIGQLGLLLLLLPPSLSIKSCDEALCCRCFPLDSGIQPEQWWGWWLKEQRWNIYPQWPSFTLNLWILWKAFMFLVNILLLGAVRLLPTYGNPSRFLQICKMFKV